MEIVKATGLLNHGNNLRLFISPAKIHREYPKEFNPAKEYLISPDKDMVIQCLFTLRDDCFGMGLLVTLPKVERVIHRINSRLVTYNELENLCDDILDRLIDELDSHMFLMIEGKYVPYYNNPENGWGNAILQFPSILADVEEASKCLALERYTASVFHLMKVLEVGLYSMATDLNITNIQVNWQNVIEQIDSAIKDFEKNRPDKSDITGLSEWKEKLQFYLDCATNFRFIKNAWRNQTTHTGKSTNTYTGEKSFQIYNHVCSFMQTLATKLIEVN